MYYKVKKLKWSHIDRAINKRHKNNTEQKQTEQTKASFVNRSIENTIQS